jgi:hypothetical protein
MKLIAQCQSRSNNSIKIAHYRSLGRRYRGAPYAGRYHVRFTMVLGEEGKSAFLGMWREL